MKVHWTQNVIEHPGKIYEYLALHSAMYADGIALLMGESACEAWKG